MLWTVQSDVEILALVKIDDQVLCITTSKQVLHMLAAGWNYEQTPQAWVWAHHIWLLPDHRVL